MSVVLWLFATAGFGQTPARLDSNVYTVVEKQPEFPGGVSAMWAYLKQNVQYPPEAQNAGINDRVLVSFIIEPDGRMTDLQLLRSIGYGCDDEALRVVRAMPRWTPGSQSGRLVRVKYNLPILFGVDYPNRGQ